MQAHKPSLMEARRMQRREGPWVPTVISHRMAAVTEWVFSPLNSTTALCVFLICSLFRWCVGKEGSPLCQATRLESKVGSGCVWIVRDRVGEREGWVRHAQTAWIHVFLWYPAQTILPEKKITEMQLSLLTVCWESWRLKKKMTRLYFWVSSVVPPEKQQPLPDAAVKRLLRAQCIIKLQQTGKQVSFLLHDVIHVL